MLLYSLSKRLDTQTCVLLLVTVSLASHDTMTSNFSILHYIAILFPAHHAAAHLEQIVVLH